MNVNFFKKYLKKCLCIYICFAIVFEASFMGGTVSSAAPKIKLSKTSVTVKAGKSKTIKLKKKGKKLKAKFSSSKPKIAKVGKKNGKITGIKKGKCIITAKYAGKKYKCKVKVTKKASSKAKTDDNQENGNPEEGSSAGDKSPEQSQEPGTGTSGTDNGYGEGNSSSGTGGGQGDGYGGQENIYSPGSGYEQDTGYEPGIDYDLGNEEPGTDYGGDSEDAQTPDATKKPSSSTKPGSTKRPAATKKPSIMIEPGGTNAPDYDNTQDYEDPYGTYEPEGGNGAQDYEDPYGTNKPDVTGGEGEPEDNGWTQDNQEPDWTDDPYGENPYEPDNTEDGNNTQNPQATKKPQTTRQPADTQKPAATKKPQATQNPAATHRPQATQSPAATHRPQATQKPVATARPQATQKPVTTARPQATSQPDIPDMPDNNAQDNSGKHYLTPYWTLGVNVYDNNGSSFTMGNKKYTQGVCETAIANNSTNRDNYIVYNLDSKFNTVSFDVGCVNYSEKSNVSIHIEAGDNIYPGGYHNNFELDRLQVFCWGKEVKHITINTEGVKQLQISIFGSYGIYGIANVKGSGGHVYERADVKDATVNQEGYITYRCKYCDASYTETLPARTECKPALAPGSTNCVRFINSDYSGETFKVMGKEYCKGVIPDYSYKDVEWCLKLDKKCSSVTFSVGPLDKKFNNKTFYGLAMYVYADRKRVNFNENGKQSDYIMLGTFMTNKTFTINTEGVTELWFKSSGELDEHYAFFDITYETSSWNPHEYQNINGRDKCINCGCYKD